MKQLKITKLLVITIALCSVLAFTSCENGNDDVSADDDSQIISGIAQPLSLLWKKKVRRNPGPEGYYLIDLYEDQWGESIWCEHPGKQDCPDFKNGLAGLANDAVFHAESEIGESNLSGQSDLGSGLTVKWIATDSNIQVGNSEIKIWVTGQNEPD